MLRLFCIYGIAISQYPLTNLGSVQVVVVWKVGDGHGVCGR